MKRAAITTLLSAVTLCVGAAFATSAAASTVPPGSTVPPSSTVPPGSTVSPGLTVPPTTTVPPSSTSISPPTEVVQVTSNVGKTALEQLAATLRAARGAVVIVRVPGNAAITASAADLSTFEDVAREARLFVVQQGDTQPNGAAAILSAFAAASFLQPGSHPASGKEAGLWASVERLTHCRQPCWPKLTTSAAPSAMGL
ncbi:MAG: hypothetical protein ACXVRS_09650, partial [Gaiellaceae bacterium]